MRQVAALNEAHSGSARGVFRPWAERADLSLPTLDSNDGDPELLIHVPFNGTVKIKACRWHNAWDRWSPVKTCMCLQAAAVSVNACSTAGCDGCVHRWQCL